jgi:hypothetical protein
VWALWLGAGALLALLSLPLWQPLRTAWRCYALHAAAERERGEVLHKLEDAVLALRIVEGSHAGDGCIAGTSWEIFERTEPGAVLDLVVVPGREGRCELVTTIEASGRLLWLISGALAMLLVGVLALAAGLTRSFTRPVQPVRRLKAEPREVRCPACGKVMDEGYLALLSGIHWRRLGEPVGLPHALAGMPGTVGWRRRPRLHAFRCVPCEVVTFQYGA